MATDDVWAQLIEKAEFCLTTGIAPSEYDEMDDETREAFIEVANKRARQAQKL